MNLIFLGPPGIGKGTHAEIAAKRLGIPRISTGEIMREEVKNGTDLGNEAKSFMDAGDLVPDELVIDIIRKRIRQDDCKRGFIFDGFPRTVNQADELNDIARIDMVLNLIAPHEVIIERIAGRMTCRECGEVYHKKNVPPRNDGICDKCGGELYQREDQEKGVVEKRLETYEKRTKPLIEYYKKMGVLREVDVRGGREEVSERVKKAIDDFIGSGG